MPPGLLTSQSPAPDTSWSSSEDAHLLFLISSMGPKQWLHIASLLPPHTPAQCRARYRLIRPPSSSPSPTSRSRSSSLPGKDGGRDKSSPLQSLGVLLTRSHPSSPSARWRTEGQLERDEAAVRGGRPKGYGMESLPIALRFVVFGDPPLRAAALGRWDWPLALLLTAVASTAGVSLLAHAHPHSVAALAALVQAATEPSSASLSAPSTSSPYHRALVSQSLCLLSPPLRLLTALLGSGVALLVLSSSYLLTVLAFVFLSRRAPSSSASVKPASSTPLLPSAPASSPSPSSTTAVVYAWAVRLPWVLVRVGCAVVLCGCCAMAAMSPAGEECSEGLRRAELLTSAGVGGVLALSGLWHGWRVLHEEPLVER